MGRLNAGTLNQRFTLITDGPAVSDGQGGFTTEPGTDTETTVWARVEVKGTSKTLDTGQVVNGRKVEVTIRQTPAALTAQRGRQQNGQTLSITGVIPDPYNEYHLLTCSDGGK